MDSSIATPDIQAFLPAENIYPNDLIPTLEYYINKIELLSLDCFDTLLWRKTATPSDVFYELQKKPLFKSIGLNAPLRVRIENQARNLKVIKEKNTEITLQDIYRYGFPTLTDEQVNTLIEEEIAAEMEACYAFPETVALIRLAHKYGKKIIIVSNTYFTETQLRRLLNHLLPTDVMNCIDTIFCSSQYNKSKNNGLFNDVIAKFNYPCNSILHIGDDLQADLIAAQKNGINAIQLIHHDQATKEMLRLHSASASIFNPLTRHQHSLKFPFRGILAKAKIEKPEQMIGYASIGPIMYTFAKFIFAEIEELKKTGKTPKVLFLMRDAYLPSLVCETLAGKSIGHSIRISRFAAFAASFKNKSDIDRYLSETIFSARFEDIAKQLLLPTEIIKPLIQVIAQSSSPIGEFISLIQRDDIYNIIVQKSALFRKRLIKYLKKHIDLKPGDTLLFVDLGYSGTAQRQLEPILQEEMNVEILGRYLIELTIPDWQSSRRGLLDPSWCDERVMLSLVSYIALLEQICTSNEKSTIDYDNQGNVIFSDVGFKKNQYTKLKNIQNECIRFANDARHFFESVGNTPPLDVLREYTMSELGRFIFLPTESEIKYLESFQFDLNLGTNDVLQVFNSAAGLNSLRKRGLFFSFMEKNKKTLRTNYPSELRSAGLELVLTLMTQCRFAIELGYKDMSLRREMIDIVVNENNKISETTTEAILTYDGYYALSLPIVNGDFQIQIKFGKKYSWIQFDNAEIINIENYLNNAESLFAKDYWSNLSFHNMKNHGSNLYECTSTDSTVIVSPSNQSNGKNYLLRLIFRPTVLRSLN